MQKRIAAMRRIGHNSAAIARHGALVAGTNRQERTNPMTDRIKFASLEAKTPAQRRREAIAEVERQYDEGKITAYELTLMVNAIRAS